MYRQLRIVISAACLSMISACAPIGSAQQSPPIVTITPADGALPISAPTRVPTSTPSVISRYSEAIEAAQAAAATGDYEQATAILAPIHSENRDNTTVAALLADLYIQWGRVLLTADPTTPGAARDALDKYIWASRLAPPAGELATQVETERAVVEAILATWTAVLELNRLAAEEGAPAEREISIEEALTQSARAGEALPDFPGVREARTAALVEAARAQEALARSTPDASVRTQALAQATEWCAAAADLWPADALPGEPARNCLRELRSLVREPARAPTAARAQSAGDGIFVAIPQRAFSPGTLTEEQSSCISGMVVRADGAPIAGAVGNVNNASTFLNWTTNGEGRYNVCGLGWSNWAVVLDYIPGQPGLSRQVSIGGVWLDGTASQQAIIVFREQR